MRVIGFLLATLALTTVCAQQTFRIVGNNGNQGFKFNLTNFSELQEDPTLNVTLGEKLTFRIEAIMLKNDPITNEVTPYAFGLTDSYVGSPIDVSSAALGGLVASSSCARAGTSPSYYTTNESNPCILTWTVVEPETDKSWYYVSNQTFMMLGTINITSGRTPITSAPGTTTSPPTGTGGATTPAPTTTAPPTGSTGKNAAAVILPGAAVLIIAAINALFA